MQLKLPIDESIFERRGAAIVFNQLGVKLELDNALSQSSYFAWLDDISGRVGTLVPGAKIAEKTYARTSPRQNTGIYYDTPARELLDYGAVLRTTCNPITHAFCAFKEPLSANGVRRDHRHVFEGDEKKCLQASPASPEAIAIVKKLLARADIAQPGQHLRRMFGIDVDSLSPSICVSQLRHPFFVWLDGRDALRCVMDRVSVTDLRLPEETRIQRQFSELELPIYPRVDRAVAEDPRTNRLIQALTESAEGDLGAVVTVLNKYQRASVSLGLWAPDRQSA